MQIDALLKHMVETGGSDAHLKVGMPPGIRINGKLIPQGDVSLNSQHMDAIARAILWQPKVVLFDEPTAALSHSAAEEVGKLIRDLASHGLAVLVISHDIHRFVLEVTDRIEVLRLGRNVASYRSSEVSGEQVVNAMVGGNEGVNLAG